MRGKRYHLNCRTPANNKRRLPSSIVVRNLRSFFSNGKCLDFGCGGGRNLRLMNQGIGVDLLIDEDLPSNVPFVRVDLNFPLPFRSSSFDVVLCSHVLEHLDSPIKALWEIRRILKEGGMLLWGFPNPKYLFSNFYKESWADHIYAWTLSTAGIQVKKAGFDVESVFRGFPKIWFPIISRILGLIPFSTYLSGEFWLLCRKRSEMKQSSYRKKMKGLL